MSTLVIIVLSLGVGFGLGRIKNVKGFFSKSKADAEAMKAAAEKAVADAKKL